MTHPSLAPFDQPAEETYREARTARDELGPARSRIRHLALGVLTALALLVLALVVIALL
jgi:hypothetical protein